MSSGISLTVNALDKEALNSVTGRRASQETERERHVAASRCVHAPTAGPDSFLPRVFASSRGGIDFWVLRPRDPA